MATGYFKGTSIEQDARFHGNDRKKNMKFPSIFERAVDMKKVNVEVMKNWIGKRLIEIMGFEDEVLINYASEHLDESELNPKDMMVSLNDMMEEDTPKFMTELWELLLDAQNQPGGVPKVLVDSVREAAELRKSEKDYVIQVIQRAQNCGSDRNSRRNGRAAERDRGRHSHSNRREGRAYLPTFRGSSSPLMECDSNDRGGDGHFGGRGDGGHRGRRSKFSKDEGEDSSVTVDIESGGGGGGGGRPKERYSGDGQTNGGENNQMDDARRSHRGYEMATTGVDTGSRLDDRQYQHRHRHRHSHDHRRYDGEQDDYYSHHRDYHRPNDDEYEYRPKYPGYRDDGHHRHSSSSLKKRRRHHSPNLSSSNDSLSTSSPSSSPINERKSRTSKK